MPLESAGQDVDRALEEARGTVERARSEGVDVRQAERLLRQAELALGAGSLATAARLAASAERSVRQEKERSAILEMAFRKMESEIKWLKERSMDTKTIEVKLAEARAMRHKDPTLAAELFAETVRLLRDARKKLEDGKKRTLLKGLGGR